MSAYSLLPAVRLRDRRELYLSITATERAAAATGLPPARLPRERSPVEILLNRRGTGLFWDPSIPDELLYAMLGQGVFDPDAIQAHLATSGYLAPPERAVPWEIVITHRHHGATEVKAALADLAEPRAGADFQTMVDLLHHVDAQLLMAAVESGTWKVDAIRAEAERMIDEFANARPMSPRDELFASAHPPTGHMTYAMRTEPIDDDHPAKVAFEAVCAALDEAWIGAERRDYARRCDQTLEELRARGLGTDVLKNGAVGDEQRLYVRMEPYLQAMDPLRFADAWLDDSPPETRLRTRDALLQRYRTRPELIEPGGKLHAERGFIYALIRTIEERAVFASGLERRTLRGLSPRFELTDAQIANRNRLRTS